MTVKRKVQSTTSAEGEKNKRQKRQTDLAAGFATQILRSPRKQHGWRATESHLEIEDAIEILSSDDDRPLPPLSSFGRSNKLKSKSAPGSSSQLTKDKVKRENLASLALGSDARPQQTRSTQTSGDEETSWLNIVPLRKTADLAVHKKKVADVQEWIEGALRNVSDRTVLILTGPAGVGKTATVETLAKVLDYEIIEWRNPMSHEWSDDAYNREADGLAQKFERFLAISDKYSALDFGQGYTLADGNRRKVIVVEDIPNTFSSNSSVSSAKAAFQSSIMRYLSSPRNRYPLILIITETEPRGEGGDWSRSDAMSTRTLLTREILDARNCTQIVFNDVAPTFISKALARIVDSLPRHLALDISQAVLDEIAQTANGDIRSACNSLQFIAHRFSTHGHLPRPRRKKKRGEILALTAEETAILNIITNRESALGYFHAIGKVIYNKRIPPALDPVKYDDLPRHLSGMTRARPETTADAILDETGTDTTTFLGGIFQNYVPSTARTDEAAGLVDALGEADTMGLGSPVTGTVGIMGAAQALPESVVRRDPAAARIYFPPYRSLLARRGEVSDAVARYCDGQGIGSGRTSVAVLERLSYHARIDALAGVPDPIKVPAYDRFSTLGRGGVDGKSTLLQEDMDARSLRRKEMSRSGGAAPVDDHDDDDDEKDEIEEVD
ncbi:Cell cycle checkpoint protein rad17 [Taphrina deformans PYCC 5710]|uniref:Cell cycle checkpoint protein rad17 n=1 Tax=Taphrina deformans (strain PYCC 5710 / ATCC 11124 / CBS 356.35 / IMI 108563 / JCM 9778 / NBRC 8474) TaxID=1097556 RepID=R4XBN0_TAPDE|nr:Cell cycle checkpoint protein rad17 [Taphrina deformans PYCC 5710]|eukprot:CCG83193.1 Cell cycle checkpoint protein rad17 [Taphrina deformans PYCC 5710]